MKTIKNHFGCRDIFDPYINYPFIFDDAMIINRMENAYRGLCINSNKNIYIKLRTITKK